MLFVSTGLFESRGFFRKHAVAAFAIGCACFTVVASVSVPARAQTEEELSEARTKFQQAIELEQAGNYSGALKLFREVGQVKLTPQIRYHIAVCEEKLGHLVVALGGYELALSHSEGMHPDFVAEVQSSVEELNARIPKLRLVRGKGADAAIVELDGVELGDAQIGVEIPINPGPHAVVARAPGYQRFQQTVEVAEGSVETLELVLEPVPAAPVVAQPSMVRDEPKSFGITPYVVGGTGAALAVIGGVFLGVSGAKVASLKDLCDGPDNTDCTSLTGGERDDAMQKERSARTFETLGWVGIGVGVAALAAGTTLFVIDRQRNRKERATVGSIRFVPAAPRATGGVTLVGSF